MAEDSVFGLIIAAFIDVVLGESGKRNKWVRVLNYAGSILFLLLIIVLIYVTVEYL